MACPSDSNARKRAASRVLTLIPKVPGARSAAAPSTGRPLPGRSPRSP
ncbi:Uncharacterised protein [Bordetella pertussis]|nr:Uncharacterised protein [Bordetella pertussis]